jgi:hypothetical protein
MEGVESVLNKDPQKGAVLLERGCELKNFDSCLMLGTEYQFGSRGIRFAQVSPTGGVGVGW